MPEVAVRRCHCVPDGSLPQYPWVVQHCCLLAHCSHPPLSWCGEPHCSADPVGFVFSSAILGFVFNFFINFGIAFTFPIFISLGTVCMCLLHIRRHCMLHTYVHSSLCAVSVGHVCCFFIQRIMCCSLIWLGQG